MSRIPNTVITSPFFCCFKIYYTYLLSGKPWPEVKAHVNKISAGTFQNIGRSGDS
jgi:hypothetical protein